MSAGVPTQQRPDLGSVYFSGAGEWIVSARSDIISRLKRIFAAGRRPGDVTLCDTGANAEDLLWFLERYPLKISGHDEKRLREKSSRFKEAREVCRSIATGSFTGPQPVIKTLLPLREYQQRAVTMLQTREKLLCGDDLGLGKTAVALGAHGAGMGPTIVVCQTHLQQQWKDQAHKFLFGVEPHIVKRSRPYDLPPHDLLIVPYSKLRGWGDALSDAAARGDYKLLVFDEAQELRRRESSKYQGAELLSARIPYCLGLTATPIYNYGDEIFNVLNVIDQNALGSEFEFLREWCISRGRHATVREPASLNAFLIESGLFLRRRRADVGRELPPVTRMIETIESDRDKFRADLQSHAELAARVVDQKVDVLDRGRAARELDLEVRRMTGLAKATAVAEFVIERVKAGEKVQLGGWHRDVYTIWESAFDRAGVPWVKYTGSESPAKKEASKTEFINGKAKVFIQSLRSGAGLDGLQDVCSLCVIGELDWSPKVHDQFIGRLNRDGASPSGVTVVFMVLEDGSDPIMSSVLGLKREQSDGIVDGEGDEVFDAAEVGRGRLLAESLIEGIR